MLMTRRDDALIDVLRLADRDGARVEYAATVYVCERSPQELVDAVVEQLFA